MILFVSVDENCVHLYLVLFTNSSGKFFVVFFRFSFSRASDKYLFSFHMASCNKNCLLREILHKKHCHLGPGYSKHH